MALTVQQIRDSKVNSLKSIQADIAKADGSIKHSVLKKDMTGLFSSLVVDQATDAQLDAVIKSKAVHAALLSLSKPADVAQMYSEISIVPEPVDPSLVTAPKGAAAAVQAIQDGDFSGALAAVSTNGKIDPLLVGAAVLGGAKLFGYDMGDAAKYGGIAGLGAMAINFIGGENGQKLIEKITGGLGAGADGIGGALGGLFSGGGGFFGDMFKNLGDMADSPVLQDLLKKAKENPIEAIALACMGVPLIKSIMSGDFGGIFDALKTGAMVLAMIWVGKSMLGMDGQSLAGGRIIEDVPATKLPPKELAELSKSMG